MNETQQGQDGQAPASAVPLYFSRTYDETMSLLLEARNCVMRSGEQLATTARARLAFSRESMRLTTRLTSVMAWLLAQRAVGEGEMTRQEASDAHKLTARDLCLETADADDSALLPPDLQQLLDRSHALYSRVARLDAQVRAQA